MSNIIGDGRHNASIFIVRSTDVRYDAYTIFIGSSWDLHVTFRQPSDEFYLIAIEEWSNNRIIDIELFFITPIMLSSILGDAVDLYDPLLL